MMGEEIRSADDLSFEKELSAVLDETSPTLKDRIGNRIYLLEDSRKRKSMDTEDTTQDVYEDSEHTAADLTHRSNAILLRGPPISQLPTARVFAYATHFDANPIGLEWVDDQTCVLVFTNRKNALQAWDALRRQPSHPGPSMNETGQVENSDENSIFQAHPLPLALYPIEERINSVLGTQKSAALKEAINIRWARVDDVKQPGARGRSEFYKKHGETAGKEGLPGIPQHKRRRYSSDALDTKRQLDADLDTIWNEGDEGESSIGRAEETRRQLDEELDSFAAQDKDATESSRTASLMERTTRPLPRRSRREGQIARAMRFEDEDGRWLHNSEVEELIRLRDIDENGSSLRVWPEDDGYRRRQTSGRGARHRRPKKTQDELDRELEEFLRQ